MKKNEWNFMKKLMELDKKNEWKLMGKLKEI